MAIAGLGNERPTLLISNDIQETARHLISRCARRNRKAQPKPSSRRCVATAGVVEVHEDRLVVTLGRRRHNPIWREAAVDKDVTSVPWLPDRRARFVYS